MAVRFSTAICAINSTYSRYRSIKLTTCVFVRYPPGSEVGINTYAGAFIVSRFRFIVVTVTVPADLKNYSVMVVRRKYLKKLLLLILMILLNHYLSIGQEIIENSTLILLDHDYVIDKNVSKKGFSTIEEYSSNQGQDKRGNYRLTKVTRLDKEGRTLSIASGQDIKRGMIDVESDYTVLEDSMVQSVSRIYKPSIFGSYFKKESTLEPKISKSARFEPDSKGVILVRSVYYGVPGEVIRKIDRYNSRDSLVEIWYPLGKTAPLNVSFDTVINKNHHKEATVFYDWRVSTFTETKEFNEAGELLRITSQSMTKSDSTINYYNEFLFYNDRKQLVRIIGSGEDHQISSIQQFEYNGNVLTKYQRFDGESENPTIKTIYDSKTGKILSSSERTGKTLLQTEYRYNRDGLVSEIHYLNNNVVGSIRLFKYR